MSKSKKIFHIRNIHPYNTRSQFRAIATESIPINYGLQIGFDNWEVIAGHLDLIGLLNLADVCVDAQHAAQLIFKRRYRSLSFRLLLSANSFGKNSKKMAFQMVKMVQIENYTISMKLLRNFGFFISQLEIDPYEHFAPIKLKKLIKYANKYCINSKNELNLRADLPILLKYPLKNVNEITVYTDAYSVCEFNALFPNIQYMKIYSDEGRIYMQHHFPQLENLYVTIYKYGDRDGINIVDIWKAIKLNPQIKSIYIEQIVQNTIENMFDMMIEGANIDLYIEWNLNWSKFRRFLCDILRPYNFQRMHLFYRHEIKDINHFVNKFKNLKFLTVESFERHSLELIDRLPMLQHFRICYRTEDRDIDEDIDDMANALLAHTLQRKLSMLSFHFEEKATLDVFQAGINRSIDCHTWNIHFNEDGPKTFKQSMVLKRIEPNYS